MRQYWFTILKYVLQKYDFIVVTLESYYSKETYLIIHD